MSEHSSLMGGSICARRMHCPGSYALEEAAPSQPASDYANEGTMLHSVMEKVIKSDKDAREMLGYTELGHELTEDLIVEVVEPALEHLDALLEAYDVEEYQFKAEARVQYRGLDAFGTVDLIIWTDTHVFIIDWKFGRGVAVSAIGNSQLRFYAGGATETKGLKEVFTPERRVVVAIIQPACREGEPLTYEEIGHNELLAFVDDVRLAIAAIKSGDDTLKAGGWCRWCKAEATCPAKTSMAQQMLEKTLDGEVDADELGALVDRAIELEDWCRSVMAMAHTELEKGREVTGYKLVAKRATRNWIDEAAAESAFRDAKIKVGDFTTSKLITPAQAEKMLKKVGKNVDLSDLIVSKSSGTTVAPASSDKPAVTPRSDGSALNLPPDLKP